MAYRGGRGRGRFGGGGFSYARQEPFVLFPEVELPDPKAVKVEKDLVILNAKFERHWESSPYYLEDSATRKLERMDIERFSDRWKPKITSKRESFQQYLELRSKNFPQELIGGLRWQPNKKVRWNTDLKKLDLFEKLEEKYQDEEGKGGKVKKEGEDEEENEDEEAEEDEGEYSDDGDYNQNEDFDDDEDDYNINDDFEDEALL